MQFNPFFSMIGLGALLVAMASLASIPDRAEAESPGVCATYADQAVQQFNAARGRNSCFSPITGARWQADREAHYNWCLSANPDAVRYEQAARANVLRVCNGEPKAKACNAYAAGAQSDAILNINRSCGYPSTARWTQSYDDHLAYCLAAPADAVNFEHNIRRLQVSLCVAPTPELKTCDAYAKTAVRQAAEAQQRGCSPGGDRWITSYDPHFSWCVSNLQTGNPQREESARKGWLSQCSTWRPGP